MSGSDYYEYEEGKFASRVIEGYAGEIYENEHTFASDAAQRFEATTVKLRGAVIHVSTHGIVIGNTTNQRYPVDADDSLAVDRVDLSKLWIKNATAGQNAKINIIGVYE